MKKCIFTMDTSSQKLADLFDQFIISRQVKGVSPATIHAYKNHYKTFANYTDLDITVDQLTMQTVNTAITAMQAKNLSPNTIASNITHFRAFTNWLKSEGYTTLSVMPYKRQETIKEVYTDDELKRLLKRPDMRHVSFRDYRSWVIINLLLNCGCRAGTLLAIRISDVDLQGKTITYRHTKTGRLQSVPLCNDMCSILNQYLSIRKGQPQDLLFCSETGGQLQTNGLQHAIAKYNTDHGVTKTSIHLFRHTFAKKYLIDCDGNAFTLQCLLGHSTLDMTRHYCNIYNTDLQNGFENHCPLNAVKGNSDHIKMR